MEFTSTVPCQHCTSTSLTENTCSLCGADISRHPSDSATDKPISTAPVSLATPAESSSASYGEIDSEHDHSHSQKIEPPSPGITKTPNLSNPTIYHPIFWGRGQTLFGIFIVNTLYTLLTLGAYAFWGRVRIRKFLSSQTSLGKIRFSYHGTAQELINGWTKALLVFGIPYGFLSLIPILWAQIPSWIPNALATIMIFGFIPVAVVGSQRYRLSRTAFGAIRFSFRGRVKAYMSIWFTGTFLTFLTAGIYYPFFENARREFLVSHSYLGNRHFSYNGTGTALLKIYGQAWGLVACVFLANALIVLQLAGISFGPEFPSQLLDWLIHQPWIGAGILINVMTLMLTWFYLQISKQRYFWNHSTFGNAPFQFTASTWNLIELRLTNFLMLVLTFGLAWSWVQIRNLQFLYYHLGIQGPLDIHQIEQEALDASPTGEELAGYFDAGFDLG